MEVHLCKRENLSSVPRFHMKTPSVVCTSIVPALGNQRHSDLGSFLASQTNEIGELQVQCEILFSNKVEGD